MFNLEEDPLPDHWNRLGVGCGGAAVMVGAALFFATRTSIRLPGRHGGLRLEGGDVTAFAITLLAIAAFLHVHYFWTGTERFAAAREIVRVLTLVTGLIAFGSILVHQAQIF